MNILGFDTSSEILSVGIKTADNFFEHSINSGFKHSEYLLLIVNKLLEESDISYKDLDLIICTNGPGSFTGLRIGMATAKGISTGINCPIVSVNTLDLIAYEAKDPIKTIVPVLDARKKRVYSAIFKKGEICSSYLDIEPTELFKKLNIFDEVLFCGSGAKIISNNFKDELKSFSFDYSFRYNSTNLVSSLIKLGELRYKTIGPDSDNSGPSYIRLSDAELLQKRK